MVFSLMNTTYKHAGWTLEVALNAVLGVKAEMSNAQVQGKIKRKKNQMKKRN